MINSNQLMMAAVKEKQRGGMAFERWKGFFGCSTVAMSLFWQSLINTIIIRINNHRK